MRLQSNDFISIRTSMPFTLASDPLTQLIDSETEAADATLGDGSDFPVVLRGGRLVFDSANEDLISDMLPSLVHIKAEQACSWRVRSLLKMNEAETQAPGPGAEFIIVRLMNLILVEILRGQALQDLRERTGPLAGLAGPITSRALPMMYKDVARDWTVSNLANLCGVLRSSFAARFRRIVGVSPIEYLMQWRIALAKDNLRCEKPSSGAMGYAVGIQSASEVGRAFTRTVGCSPERYAIGKESDQPSS